MDVNSANSATILTVAVTNSAYNVNRGHAWACVISAWLCWHCNRHLWGYSVHSVYVLIFSVLRVIFTEATIQWVHAVAPKTC